MKYPFLKGKNMTSGIRTEVVLIKESSVPEHSDRLGKLILLAFSASLPLPTAAPAPEAMPLLCLCVPGVLCYPLPEHHTWASLPG